MYELEGEDCSKFHEEIVRIMKYDPIEKIKTSTLMSDLNDALMFCVEIAKAVVKHSSNTDLISANKIILSGDDMVFLCKVKIYAAKKLKIMLLDEASRNSNYIRICRNKNHNPNDLWEALAWNHNLV
jgi:hypothetical protein